MDGAERQRKSGKINGRAVQIGGRQFRQLQNDDPSRVIGGGRLDVHTRAFYRESIIALHSHDVPFLVGGAYALEHYVGVTRHTRDFDAFVQRGDLSRALDALHDAGCETEVTFPHWLGKALRDGDLIDVIFSSGNGVAAVDDAWFEHANDGRVFGLPVRFVPAEEMIWSKAFIMERERYDGADVAHLLRALADRLDWPRLLERFGENWRVLFCHIVLLDFIYPGEGRRVPGWVMRELTERFQRDHVGDDPPDSGICRGTLLSRAQYLVDVEKWGYRDARLHPEGAMSRADIRHWTAAIRKRA